MVGRVLGTLILAALTLSLAGCESNPLDLAVDLARDFGGTITGVAVTGPSTVSVGASESLGVSVTARNTATGSPVPQAVVERLQQPKVFLWTVEPSDGARVDDLGIFKATKPGTYTVTATAFGHSASLPITVTEAADAYAGTYGGATTDVLRGVEYTIALRFTVGPDAVVSGTFSEKVPRLMKMDGTINGIVTGDGRLQADLRVTAFRSEVPGGKLGSRDAKLSGRIDQETGVFSGTASGGGAVLDVTATRK
jgi:hypothetical protein